MLPRCASLPTAVFEVIGPGIEEEVYAEGSVTVRWHLNKQVIFFNIFLMLLSSLGRVVLFVGSGVGSVCFICLVTFFLKTTV